MKIKKFQMDGGKSVVDKILREHNKLHLIPLIPQDLMTLMVSYQDVMAHNDKLLTSRANGKL